MLSHVRVQSKVRVQSVVGERDRMEVLNKVRVPSAKQREYTEQREGARLN